MNRRSFLRGAVLAAPAVILTPGLLMPVRPVYAAADVLTLERLRAAYELLVYGTVITLNGRVLDRNEYIEHGSVITLRDPIPKASQITVQYGFTPLDDNRLWQSFVGVTGVNNGDRVFL